MQYESYPVHLTMYDSRIDKDAWIDDIIDYIRHMEIDDDILVYDYGKSGNLKLDILMDDDTDVRILVDAWANPKDGGDGLVYAVDETEWFYSNELKMIREELARIWNEDYVID